MLQKIFLAVFPFLFLGGITFIVLLRFGVFKKKPRFFTNREKEVEFNSVKQEIELRTALFQEGYVK